MKTSKRITPHHPATSVDWAEVNRVLEFMNQHGLEEFEFASGDTRVRLKKPGPAPVAFGGLAPGNMSIQSAPGAVASGPKQSPAMPSVSPESASDNLHVVKSPIVGTFYSSPNPESAPYVKVGDKVKAGQVLCIIEAMKLMNEIEADATGEIVKVLATNAQPVEYGEGLFAIRPDGK